MAEQIPGILQIIQIGIDRFGAPTDHFLMILQSVKTQEAIQRKIAILIGASKSHEALETLNTLKPPTQGYPLYFCGGSGLVIGDH